MESSTTAAIVDALTRAIVEHRLHPGSKLAEQKLADHFGVSRTLVRQALFQLSQNRLIRLEPARGAFVAVVGVVMVGGLAASGDETLFATVTRVASSGLSETIECRSPRFPDRLLSYTVDCGPAGCILQARDATAVEEMQQWRDRHDSVFKAVEAAGGACAIVNLRGRVEQASNGLVGLTGASVEALTSARLVSLVAVGDRSTLGDAFEAAIDHRAPRSVGAAMLVGGAALRRVTIGLAPLSCAGRIVGVTAVVAPAAS